VEPIRIGGDPNLAPKSCAASMSPLWPSGIESVSRWRIASQALASKAGWQVASRPRRDERSRSHGWASSPRAQACNAAEPGSADLLLTGLRPRRGG
jgi:hypothetical protein